MDTYNHVVRVISSSIGLVGITAILISLLSFITLVGKEGTSNYIKKKNIGKIFIIGGLLILFGLILKSFVQIDF